MAAWNSFKKMPHVALSVVMMTSSVCAGAWLNEHVRVGEVIDHLISPKLAYAQETPVRPPIKMVNKTLPDIASVFDAQKAKVVGVKTEMASGTPWTAGKKNSRTGQGSGFIVESSGYIITNYHVVAGASKIQVSLSTGKRYRAKLVGADKKTDIALLKIAASTPLPSVTLGDSNAARVGEWLVAIGSPFGLEYSVTTGILSAKGRRLGQGPYDDFLQTDASINPGNSGGPLFNLYGEVIGVNTAIIRNGQGIGFAVPANIVKSILPQLKSKGYVVRGYIGAGIQPLSPELAESFKLPTNHGVVVGSMTNGGPSSMAGLKVGDVITHFNKRRVRSVQALLFAVAETTPGTSVPVKFIRSKRKLSVSLTVKERQDKGRKSMRQRLEREQGGISSSPETLKASLGVEAISLDAQMASQLKVPSKGGAYIQNVLPNTPATGALRPGDVVLQVNQYKVPDAASLQKAMVRNTSSSVRMLVWRDDKQIFVAVRTKEAKKR